MNVEIPTLILAVHAVVALVFFGFAALTLADGGPLVAAGLRALLGLLVLGLGVGLYVTRSRQAAG